jgi:sugar lactone lactonase YvrE
MTSERNWIVGGLLLALAACGGDGEEMDAAAGDTAATAAAAADTQVVRVADAGLQTPESVLHDADADVYLVSNINGQPTGKDGNGFISRVRPDGTVENLKWIDGAAEGVRLNGPKGMALKGDTLFVSDIDSVRAFNRTTGQPLGARGVPSPEFLNDLAVGGDGTLYVTDTGVTASFEPTGNAAIYRFGPDGQAQAVARGDSLAAPNGIAIRGGRMWVAPFAAATVRRLDLGSGGDAGQGGAGQVVATLPGGQLDGIVVQDDDGFFVSSWETSAVYHVTAGGEVHEIITGVPSPADIGYDARRNRILIPVFMESRLEFHPLPY